jgi:hypothetical protein
MTTLRLKGGPYDGKAMPSPSRKTVAEVCMGEAPPRSHYVRDKASGAYVYRSQCNEDCPGGLGWPVWHGRT